VVEGASAPETRAWNGEDPVAAGGEATTIPPGPATLKVALVTAASVLAAPRVAEVGPTEVAPVQV
jgi:hypothetical protein